MNLLKGLQRDPKLLQVIDSDFVRLIPADLNMTGGRDSFEAHSVSREMRNFYIGARSVGIETAEEMINVSTFGTPRDYV